MRPLSFDPQALRKQLLRHKIATLPELKAALGTSADLTVFRKLKLLDYLSSYTHRGRYYALRVLAIIQKRSFLNGGRTGIATGWSGTDQSASSDNRR
jgi:hypothetical protein